MGSMRVWTFIYKAYLKNTEIYGHGGYVALRMFMILRRCSLLLRVIMGDVPGFNNNENICLLCQSRCVGPSGKLIHRLECRETQ